MYAQYNLGALWADPPGNYAPDYDQALFWLRLAKYNGYPGAQATIDEVEGLRNLQDNLTTGILDSALSLLTGQDPECKEIFPGSPPVCPGDDDEPLIPIPTSTPGPTPTPTATPLPTATPIPPVVDVRVKGIYLDPVKPSLGDTVDFTVTVENQGNIPANDVVITFGDVAGELGSVQKTLSVVGSGESQDVMFQFAGGRTDVQLSVEITAKDDADLSNNYHVIDHKAHLLPDLVVESVTSASGTFPGTTHYTVVVKNQGDGTAIPLRKAELRVRVTVGETVKEERLYLSGQFEVSPGDTRQMTFTFSGEATDEIRAFVDVFPLVNGGTEYDNYVESDETNNELIITGPF